MEVSFYRAFLRVDVEKDFEIDFYELIGNFLLQQRQRTAIKGNLF